MEAHGSGRIASTQPPEKFSILSWNIDGLDERNLKRRVKMIAKIIEM